MDVSSNEKRKEGRSDGSKEKRRVKEEKMERCEITR